MTSKDFSDRLVHSEANESVHRSILYANLRQMKRLKCRICRFECILEIANEMVDAQTIRACASLRDRCAAVPCYRILSACSSTILQYVHWLNWMESFISKAKNHISYFLLSSLHSQLERVRDRHIPGCLFALPFVHSLFRIVREYTSLHVCLSLLNSTVSHAVCYCCSCSTPPVSFASYSCDMWIAR